MFKMDMDQAKKTLVLYAEGFFTMEEGQRFVAEYLQKTQLINPTEYALIVDGKGVKASTPEVAQALQGAMSLYLQVPFKKRFIVNLDSAVAQSQVVRLGKELPGFDSITFVNSKEEAFKLL